jgi:hypothetical protein
LKFTGIGPEDAVPAEIKEKIFDSSAHSFGHILTKKCEISRTFGLKKRGISRAFKLV